MAFFEVARVEEFGPMQLWGGREGLLTALYLATTGRGGVARMFRHPLGASPQVWLDDAAPEGAETLHKMRDLDGRVFCFFETGPEGSSCVISRDDADPTAAWGFEPIGNEPDFVGGRALEVHPSGQLAAGGSGLWNEGTRNGKLFVGTPGVAGSFSEVRALDPPSIAWEVVRLSNGVVWEFWNGIEGTTTSPHAFRDGLDTIAPPGDCAVADEFQDYLYVGTLDANVVRTPISSVEWGTVFTVDAEGIDHVVWVPRGDGELWVTGHAPLKVYKSLDGTTFEEQLIPGNPDCSGDDNNLTAVAYFQHAVWVATRDANLGLIRIYVDRPQDIILQVI